MSVECDECFLSGDIERLEQEISQLERLNSLLLRDLKEIADIYNDPSFRNFSFEEKLERIQQIVKSALRSKL